MLGRVGKARHQGVVQILPIRDGRQGWTYNLETDMDTKTAMAYAIDYIAKKEGKTEKEMIMILLIEALTARGILHPMPKEDK